MATTGRSLSRTLLVAGLLVLLAGTGTVAGCSQRSATTGQLRVVAGFYPLQFVAEQVGGSRVRVTSLAQPGTEPHDLELSPRQVADVADADLVVYLAGFQPALDEAVTQEAGDAGFDATAAVELIAAGSGPEPSGGPPQNAARWDPHVWLDPARLNEIAKALAQRLAALDPPDAGGYLARAGVLEYQLTELDREIAGGLATCQRREIVVSHAAFGYLAQRYHLTQVAITGLAPELEPTPQRLAEVAAIARRHHATTIFFETLVSPKVAQAVAAEIGVRTMVLDPIEGLPQGATGDYFSLMRANLVNLRSGLGCT